MRQRKIEDYMKTIYLLTGKGAVRGSDISRELNVKRPTVTVSLKELEYEGYVKRMADHSVILTSKGMKIAKEVTDRNAGIYELLISLGISESVAVKDACSMEHVLSMESFKALIELGRSRPECGLFEPEQTLNALE